MALNRTELEKRFLTLFPRGSPTGLSDTDLQAYVGAATAQSQMPGQPFYGTSQGRVQAGMPAIGSSIDRLLGQGAVIANPSAPRTTTPRPTSTSLDRLVGTVEPSAGQIGPLLRYPSYVPGPGLPQEPDWWGTPWGGGSSTPLSTDVYGVEEPMGGGGPVTGPMITDRLSSPGGIYVETPSTQSAWRPTPGTTQEVLGMPAGTNLPLTGILRSANQLSGTVPIAAAIARAIPGGTTGTTGTSVIPSTGTGTTTGTTGTTVTGDQGLNTLLGVSERNVGAPFYSPAQETALGQMQDLNWQFPQVTNLEPQVQQAILNLLGGSAQSPEVAALASSLMQTGLPTGFDEAYMRRFYEPQREALLADLSQRGILDSGERLRSERELFQQGLMDSLLLQQQQAQQAGANLALQNLGLGLQGTQAGISGYGTAGNLALQNLLGQAGVTSDIYRQAEASRQFDISNLADVQRQQQLYDIALQNLGLDREKLEEMKAQGTYGLIASLFQSGAQWLPALLSLFGAGTAQTAP